MRWISVMALVWVSVFGVGCAAISQLPSMQHCSEVSYVRKNAAMTLHAECAAGYGSAIIQ